MRTLVFANGDTESLLVTALEFGVFRLEDSSAFGDLLYHDVIRASVRDDRALAMSEVVSRSGLTTLSWVISRKVIDSVEFAEFLSYVVRVGGVSERLFGGWLLVHVPPNLSDAVANRFEALLPPTTT